jgi:hypothetical protein
VLRERVIGLGNCLKVVDHYPTISHLRYVNGLASLIKSETETALRVLQWEASIVGLFSPIVRIFYQYYVDPRFAKARELNYVFTVAVLSGTSSAPASKEHAIKKEVAVAAPATLTNFAMGCEKKSELISYLDSEKVVLFPQSRKALDTIKKSGEEFWKDFKSRDLDDASFLALVRLCDEKYWDQRAIEEIAESTNPFLAPEAQIKLAGLLVKQYSEENKRYVTFLASFLHILLPLQTHPNGTNSKSRA